MLVSAIAAVAFACQKDREVFGIVASFDPTFTVRITATVPRVVVGEDQRIAVEGRLGSKCGAELEYTAAGSHVPLDIDKADVGPETVSGSGLGVAELTWQVRRGTLPQLVTVVVTCYSGANFSTSSVPAETTFEILPNGVQ